MINILLNAFYILGLKEATREPYILAPLEKKWNQILLGWNCQNKVLDKLRSSFYEMTIGCTKCMASFHSVVFITTCQYMGHTNFTINFSIFTILAWLIYVCILSFVVDFFDMIKEIILNVIVKS